MFARHNLHVECVGVNQPSTVISASQGGQVLIWNSLSGIKLFKFFKQNI